MSDALDTGTLVGIVCSVIGVALLFVVVLVVVCLCKRAHPLKRHRGQTNSMSVSSSQQPLRTTNSSISRGVDRNSESVSVRASEFDQAETAFHDFLRQQSHTSCESQMTTNTPLAPATPRTEHHNELLEVQYSASPNVSLALELSHPDVHVPYNGAYVIDTHAVQNGDSTYQEALATQVAADWRQWNCGEQSWGIMPLLSQDLFLTRDTRSGELYVTGLAEATAARLDAASSEAERTSIADYQRDLDAAARRPPTHAGRSASHSFSLTRSHTPSILEQPEQEADDQIYVNCSAIQTALHVRQATEDLPYVATVEDFGEMNGMLLDSNSYNGARRSASADSVSDVKMKRNSRVRKALAL